MANISQIKLPDNSTYNIKAIGLASQAKTISNVAIASFSDGADNVPVSSLIVDIDAVQDLHGYNKPWVGAGKNKLQLGKSILDNWFATDGNGTTVDKTVDIKDYVTCSIDELNGSIQVTNYVNDGYRWLSKVLDLEKNTSYIYSEVKTTGSRPVILGFNSLEDNAQGTKIIDLTNNIEFNTGNYEYIVISIYPPNFNSKNMMIRLSTETDASFEPYSNICPISGWSECNIHKSGINLWDEEWEVGGLSTSNALNSKNFIPVKEDTTYYFNAPKGAWIYKYDKSYNQFGTFQITNNATFVIPSGTFYIKFEMYGSYGTTYNNDISINYPATDTSYHSYNGGIDTISLGTTVYGGTLNVKTGELTITHGYIDLGVQTWFYGGGSFFDTADIGAESSTMDIIATSYPCESSAYFENHPDIVGLSISASQKVRFYNSDATSPSDVQTLLNGCYLCYKLATPTTVQLTPTEVRSLLNDNNIFADTGNINELVYFKTGCESITELIDVMHDDSKMSYSNVYYKKTCNQLTDPGIYYNIDTTGSPAEGYTMTALITTYNCQILVYLGLVVNIRRVNHHPISGISFSPWKRLANEDDLDGAVIPYNAEYPSLGTIYDVIESIKSNLVKSVLLTSSMNCTYADSSTIGYRTTNADRVQVSTMTGYPTGKTILGYIFEYAYVGNVGEYYKIASVNLNDGYVYANSKVSGTVRFGLRVIYID